MKIYIVTVSIGEYSDREEKVIKAYTDFKKAKDHVIRAQEKHNFIVSLLQPLIKKRRKMDNELGWDAAYAEFIKMRDQIVIPENGYDKPIKDHDPFSEEELTYFINECELDEL